MNHLMRFREKTGGRGKRSKKGILLGLSHLGLMPEKPNLYSLLSWEITKDF